MGARLSVQSGVDAGSTHWIEKKVVRVGSDPASDILLPSSKLERHALTIEYRHPNYCVHNRSGRQLTIGGMLLSPGDAALWSDADLLQIGELVLALELDEDLRPEPAPPQVTFASLEAEVPGNHGDRLAASHALSDARGGQSVSGEEGDTSETKRTAHRAGKTLMQLAVIVLCLAGCGLLLARERFKVSPAGSRLAPSLDVVVERALGSGDIKTAALVAELQMAEAARVRRQVKTARQKYRRLYDRLALALKNVANGKTTDQRASSSDQSPSDRVGEGRVTDDPLVLMQRFVESRLQ